MSVSRIYEHSLNEVFEATVKALKTCGFEITEKTTHTIKASSGISLRSWGENIKVNLSSTSKGIEVRATSEPATQLFDLGKSEENVSRLLSELDKQLG